MYTSFGVACVTYMSSMSQCHLVHFSLLGNHGVSLWLVRWKYVLRDMTLIYVISLNVFLGCLIFSLFFEGMLLSEKQHKDSIVHSSHYTPWHLHSELHNLLSASYCIFDTYKLGDEGGKNPITIHSNELRASLPPPTYETKNIEIEDYKMS